MTTTIPAGYKLVPEIMTLDMCVAFAEAWFSKVRCIDDHDMQDAYAAMLDAAPAAPGVSTVEQEVPAAYLTLDEEGSPCMLFFDVVEARTYCEVGEEPVPLYRRPAPAAGDALTAAARDVLAERQRQQTQEGWDADHDDAHHYLGELASAGAAYARCAALQAGTDDERTLRRPLDDLWPWSAEWWKPGTARRNLEKAGALILAEIERLDRAAIAAQRQGDA